MGFFHKPLIYIYICILYIYIYKDLVNKPLVNLVRIMKLYFWGWGMLGGVVEQTPPVRCSALGY